MDWAYKGLMTATVVALVLLVARTFGRRVAGLLAGLPLISAPALVWLAEEHGAAFAAQSAGGTIAACGGLALYALGFDRLSRRMPRLPALALSLALGLAAATALAPLAPWPLALLGVACAVCGIALWGLPLAPVPATAVPRLPFEVLGVSVAAGVVSGSLALAAPALGSFGAGLLAAVPIISVTTILHQHWAAGSAATTRFLRGYVAGLLGKAVFGAVFAALVGDLPVAVTLVCAMACGGGVAAWTLQRHGRRAAMAAAPPSAAGMAASDAVHAPAGAPAGAAADALPASPRAHTQEA